MERSFESWTAEELKQQWLERDISIKQKERHFNFTLSSSVCLFKLQQRGAPAVYYNELKKHTCRAVARGILTSSGIMSSLFYFMIIMLQNLA